MSRRFPILLLVVYVVVFVALGISPYERAVWWAENIPIVAIVALLVLGYVRGIVFTNLAYAMMAVLVFLHTVGGHYTFERVPFDLVTRAFGFERNHYDRVAHFSVGFYAFAISELLITKRLVTRPWVAYALGICAIGTVAELYEVIEWLYADIAGGSAGAAFLGSQGDVWDAQKDMLADTLGAVFATVIYAVRAALARGSNPALRAPA